MECNCGECLVVVNYRLERQPTSGITFASWCNEDRAFFEYERYLNDSVDQNVEYRENGGPISLVSVASTWSDDSSFPGQAYVTGGSITLTGLFGFAFTLGGTLVGTTTLTVRGESASYLQTGTQAEGYSSIQYNDQEIVSLVSGAFSYFDGLNPIAVPLESSLEFYSDDPENLDATWTITASATSPYWRTAPLGRWSYWGYDPFFDFIPSSQTTDRFWNHGIDISAMRLLIYNGQDLVYEAGSQSTGPLGFGMHGEQHPTATATSSDGIYLAITEDDRDDDVGKVPSRELYSFVVDTDPPVVAFAPPSDFFVDDPDGAIQQRYYATSTKPATCGIVNNASLSLKLESDATGQRHAVRPAFPAATPKFWANGTTPLDALGVGAHVVTPLLSDGAYTAIMCTDRAGNVSNFPTFPVTVHAVPLDGKRGARPLLEDVGFQTREYHRARFADEPVKTVRLTFDKAVQPETVSASHVSLTKDGSVVSAACTITQESTNNWLINLSVDEQQTQKTFWVLTYDPGGEVMTAGPDPESCVLAARVSWIMALSDGWMEPLDTNKNMLLLGPVMSLTKSDSLIEPPDGELGISTTQLIGDWGTTRLGCGADGYIPGVPPPSQTDSVYSYWGLKTTIHPCEPRALPCPLPMAPQRHASAIRSDDDITSFTLQLVKIDETVLDPYDPIAYPVGTVTLQNQRDSMTLQQNTWTGSFEHVLEDWFGEVVTTTVTVKLVARRFVSEYPGMKTSYLWRLDFQVDAWMDAVDLYMNLRAASGMSLSASQEDTLASGGLVYVGEQGNYKWALSIA